MLRRRLAKEDHQGDHHRPSSSSPTVQAQVHDNDKDEVKDKQIILKPRSKRRNGLIFALGGLFGIFIALFFANQQEVISLDSLMDLNLDALIDVIPQGIVKDAREFSVWYFIYLFIFHMLFANNGWVNSNMNEKPSVTIPSPSVYTSNRKALKPNTPSS